MTSNHSGPSIPDITVQIVHIEGPRKGQIDELSATRITIGRDPSNNVVYGKDLRMVSRHHAEIIREGNRFLLKNLSPNGCLVNGQPAQDAYLKQGDVIAFAEGGPKISFLYTVQAAARPRLQPSLTLPARPSLPSTPAASAPRPGASPPGMGRESAQFTIQFGTSIKSYKQPAVTLGRDAGNQFVVSHPRVLPMHAELFFQNGQYYLRDVSQSQATLLNGRPIHTDTPLQNNDVITLGDGGPQLRFLGQGRFAEVLEQPFTPPPPFVATPSPQSQTPKEPSVKDVLKSFFKK
jgi:pSer/pThr/pTyr-binding forkhead associated (FHA) protein